MAEMGDQTMTEQTMNGGRRQDRLGDRLVADGVITDAALIQALEQQRTMKGFLGETLVSLGAVTPSQLSPYLEDLTGFSFIDISELEIDPEIAGMLPEATVSARRALPFRVVDDEVHVAMADPLNLAAWDELKAVLNMRVVPYMALGQDLSEAIRRTFDVRQRARSVLAEIIEIGDGGTEESVSALLKQAEEAPIVRLVNDIIVGAIGVGASDVHLEPQETNVRVRYRIDGLLYEQMVIPLGHLAACTSRLKIMAQLDIAERRRSQDGRFTLSDGKGNFFDVRLSVMPTVHGEKSCMRLLPKSQTTTNLDRLGLYPDQKVIFESFVRRPHGLVLVTGPTGSGKSTTLYAGLLAINSPTLNINTVEDPVEFSIAGINQTQVNNRIDVTFANGLRTLVRQDPDVILVGEIRDSETASIAVQAALTGHLVLSSLHTNDAPGALIRLLNMGIEPFLVSSSVAGVVGQRLLRSLCPYCREAYTPTEEESLEFGLPIIDGQIPQVSRIKGCKRCGGRGTKGRTAVAEMFAMSDALRQMVLSGCSAAELSAQAIADGMTTMRETAVRKALDHEISLDEIVRVFAQEI